MGRFSKYGVIVAWCAMSAMACSLAQAHIVEYIEKFDGDVTGMPPGWVHTGETSNTSVSDLASVSAPKSFMIDHNGNSDTFEAARNQYTFPGFDFNTSTPMVFYQFDFNVDSIGDSIEGFGIRVWNGSSNIHVGSFRLVRAGAAAGTDFALRSNHTGLTFASLHFDTWYNLRVEYRMLSADSLQASYYLDGVNFYSEVRNLGLGPGNLNNISLFEILEYKSLSGTGSRMFIDNLVIGVPEPTSAALLAAGSLLVLRRRRNVTGD